MKEGLAAVYRVKDRQMSVYDYIPPYHGELSHKNRWVRLASAIDWDAFEHEYSALFARGGKVAIPARVALGSLIIGKPAASPTGRRWPWCGKVPICNTFWG